MLNNDLLSEVLYKFFHPFLSAQASQYIAHSELYLFQSQLIMQLTAEEPCGRKCILNLKIQLLFIFNLFPAGTNQVAKIMVSISTAIRCSYS